MSDQGFSELVWENGQLLTRGFAKRSENSPPCNVVYHSFHSRLESKGRPKFLTSDSFVDVEDDDDYPHNTGSVPKSHFKEYFSEDYGGNSKLLHDSQVVPVHENASNTQVSTPLKRPTMDVSLPPNSKTFQDLEPDRKEETVNFSLFLRSPAVVPTTNPNDNGGFPRAEKLLNSPKDSRIQLDLMDISVPDDEAVNNGQNSRLPDVKMEENRKPDDGKCKEQQVVPSSSMCSLGASNNNTYITLKRRYEDEDTEGSASPSDHNEEKPERKTVPARGSRSKKKKRSSEVHNLSERRRRDKINMKMRALQELIPNCNKVDKASMLDEAIEYMKTLQFQVKMMSMGSGICVLPMMLPNGMQFSPMGMRMHMGVGCINPALFLMPGIYPETRIPMPGFSGHPHHQPLPMSMLNPSLGPMAGVSRIGAAPMDYVLPTNSKDSFQNM